MKSLTSSLYLLPQSVFTLKEIALILGASDIDNLKSRINYFVKKGDLMSLRRGIYAKTPNYNKFELATRIFVPAYVSLETVLQAEGIVFQNYERIFVISYQTREIEIDGTIYSFKKIKTEILTEKAGLIAKDSYFVASPERAFLDALYLYKNYHFDNLAPIDWQKLKEILPIYQNKSLVAKVAKYERQTA